MAVIKCKMCGGDIEISPDKTFGTCEYCGSTMTFPKIDDDQRAAMFNRGNHFRRAGEFDKALAVYERIVAEDDTDAEAHWCCALCRFGIEYVEDPNTYEYLPTCHRASFDSILQDVDYLAALEHSDGITRRQYQRDAARIAEVQKGILATSQNEEPFDVFLCYKETDAVTGERSRDSLDAQEVYYRLTERGYRVFFSRITLEDKAGAEYEPYIFAALNSARVMVVLGSRPEHFSAVWVKNEWSRFLALMKKDRSRLLIPCYKGMDPYDLPEQLAVLQSYDMAKIGFMQDLIRGVDKVLAADRHGETVKETVVVQQSAGGPNASALLKRGRQSLEDGEWEQAKSYFDQVLSMDAENAEAFLGMALAKAGVRDPEEYIRRAVERPLREERRSIPAAEEHIRAAAAEKAVPGYLSVAEIRKKYSCDLTYRSLAAGARELAAARKSFAEDRDLARAFRYAAGETKKKLEAFRSELDRALDARVAGAEEADRRAKERKQSDYAAFLARTDRSVEIARQQAEKRWEKDRTAREEAERKELLEKREAELWKARAKKIGIIAAVAAAVVLAGALLAVKVIIPGSSYKKARALLEAERYDEAIAAFEALNGYRDSAEQLTAAQSAKLDKIAVRNTVAAGSGHTVGLRADGSVVAVGSNTLGQCDVKDWTDIVAVAAGWSYTVGLRADGTVVAVGENTNGQCSVDGWTDIVAVAAGYDHTVGLRADGSVVAVGSNTLGQCRVDGWTDIVAVAAGCDYTVGLRADGTVVVVGYNSDGQCRVERWTDIVAVAAGFSHTVGLRADGTVVAVGNNTDGQCGVGSWTDIVAVAAGMRHTVGLRADGSVVAVGSNASGQCGVGGWTDIVAVAAGSGHTVGLRADGSVVAVGYDPNSYGECDVGGWRDIRLPG